MPVEAQVTPRSERCARRSGCCIATAASSAATSPVPPAPASTPASSPDRSPDWTTAGVSSAPRSRRAAREQRPRGGMPQRGKPIFQRPRPWAVVRPARDIDAEPTGPARPGERRGPHPTRSGAPGTRPRFGAGAGAGLRRLRRPGRPGPPSAARAALRTARGEGRPDEGLRSATAACRFRASRCPSRGASPFQKASA